MATITKRKGPLGTSYQAKIRVLGHPQASATFDSLAEAKNWATQTEAAMKLGTFRDTKRESKATFNDLLDKYIAKECVEGNRRYKDPGQQKRRAEFFRASFPDFCAMYVINIQSHHVAEIRDTLAAAPGRKEGKSKSPSTVNNRISLISAVFDLAIKEWGFQNLINPVQNIRRMSVKDSRQVRISDEDIEKILEHITLDKGKEILLILLFSAMRRSEVCLLDWSFISLEENTIFLPVGYCKNSEAREVPIGPMTKEILQAQGVKEKGRVFNVLPDSLTHAFLNAVEKAGFEDIRLHDLRHEAASRFSDEGKFNILEISEMGGWKTLQLLRRYIKPKGKNMAKKLEK